jgi:hypothetical protein
MQVLRIAALVLSLGLMSAYAQQEVDPDHFDSPASKPSVQQVQHSAAQHRHSRQMLASQHGGKKNHSRHARTSA